MCQSNLIPLVSPITVVIHEIFMDALIMNPLKVFCTIKSSISRCICTHIIRTPLQKNKKTNQQPTDESLISARIPNTQDADTELDWMIHTK